MLNHYHYTDTEYDWLLESMVILVDTREKVNQHILNYFEKKNIQFVKRALSQGDYSFMLKANERLSIPRDLYFDNEIVIERKASLEELSGNLTQQRDRFEKELALCKARKILLIENATYEDVIHGNYDTKYNKKSFWASLHSFWFKYDLPFVFIKDNTMSGIFILGMFKYFLRDYMKGS